MPIYIILSFISVFLFLFYAVGGVSTGIYFLHLPSLVLVLGGAVYSALLNFPLEDLRTVPRWIYIALNRKTSDLNREIDDFLGVSNELATKNKRDIANKIKRLKDPFLRYGFTLIADNESPENIHILLKELIYHLEKRYTIGVNIFEQTGKFAPAFGMLGTIIGLILLLFNMKDMALVGQNMALALMTTFYGVIIASLFCHPIAGRLKLIGFKEKIRNEVFLEGMISIAKNESMFIIKERLNLLKTSYKG